MSIEQVAITIDTKRLLVFNIIKKKKPHLPLDILEDAYSTASLTILQNYKSIKNIELELITQTYTEIGKIFKEQQNFKRYVLEEKRHYDKIDFNNLDQRIYNNLTRIQQLVFEKRLQNIPPSKMNIGKSSENISQISHGIILRYKRFMIKMKGITLEKIETLPQQAKQVMLLYYQGYRPIVIASMLNKSKNYVSTQIFLSRQKIL